MFHREALAGEQLIYEVEMLHLRPEGASVGGRVLSDGAPSSAEAEIFFAHLDQSRSQQLFGDHNFVFSGEMKYLLDRMMKPTAAAPLIRSTVAASIGRRRASATGVSMAASSRRTVITGIGVLSPIGLDAASFWRSLLEGRSGIRPIRAFDASALPVRFAGEIPDFRRQELRRQEASGKACA